MDEKLNTVLSESATLSVADRERLEALVKETQLRHRKLAQSVDNLTDSLGTLRMVVTYQTFDLEATRRENDLLRGQILEQNATIELLNKLLADARAFIHGLGYDSFDTES